MYRGGERVVEHLMNRPDSTTKDSDRFVKINPIFDNVMNEYVDSIK